MKSIFLLMTCLLLMGLNTARADLITVSGNVSGTWSADTVLVVGDVGVADGQVLTIQPGVEVLFKGFYKFVIEGQLTAAGTAADSIIFTPTTSSGRWGGLRFQNPDAGSILEYCRVDKVHGQGYLWYPFGGGVELTGTLTLRHCEISNNVAHDPIAYPGYYNGMGGGIKVNDGSNVTIEYCHIASNHSDYSGGIDVGNSCTVDIGFNMIEQNWSRYQSGGMEIYGSTASIHDNVIRDNIAKGTMGGGGILLWGGAGSSVTNNLIIGNATRGMGGGIFSRYSTPLISNNTIIGNAAGAGGGIDAVTDPGYLPTVRNCIIWGNLSHSGAQINGACNVIYCDVQGGWAGVGNIDTDPLFVTGPGGEFYLSQIQSGQSLDSPCLDASHPATPQIIGTTRTDQVQDSYIMDMGYHYPLSSDVTLAASVESPLLSRENRGDLAVANPNPFNPTTALSYQLSAACQVNLRVYDVAGRLVATLVDGVQPAGTHSATFDGSKLTSGIYLYVLRAGQNTITGKLALVK